MEVQKHLRDFNRIERVTDFHPGAAPRSSGDDMPTDDETSCILCISPHTFPARTELFVQTAHLLPEVAAVSVGEGERLEWVRRVDRGLDRVTAIPSERLWRRPPDGALPLPTVHGSPVVTFIPWARRDQLDALHRAASCVIVPGFGEVFGHAVLDAMSWGTPAVVCRDGGSLRELVESTGSGLVVDPEPRAMADAVRRLIHDRRLAEQCRRNAREAVAHRFTWEAAFAQLEFAVDAVMQT
jgi:glycosyltransferase involved in cell wall biosynthesis